ncbi:hypothetical protein M406DRAFT_330912 [Cryphonectria parasitica EP155]|uniref:Uncharacterized protein n=1 Tax=Cryphonectria parasitica (strain ATCC 38755 / EP155) TaxID=660469 RepID=A0A9P5CNQ6_CRYP1|nr:uncharacterized protein M406DRAFT_330912 [Cryphonectria parasitica EP155]KAF3764582.1 hypothetical protein M406DRAFT_330912 [Cryphonectria parasitica EP155]
MLIIQTTCHRDFSFGQLNGIQIQNIERIIGPLLSSDPVALFIISFSSMADFTLGQLQAQSPNAKATQTPENAEQGEARLNSLCPGRESLPLVAQEQLRAHAHRREVAVSFKHTLGQCRLALTYSVVGWAGTLEKNKIPTSIANAPSIAALNNRIDTLERALEHFLPHPSDADFTLGADNLSRIEYARIRLLNIEPGVRSVRHIGPLLEEIEREARAARIIPPQDQNGWAWNWTYDDWFRWDGEAKKWVAATQSWRLDYLV